MHDEWFGLNNFAGIPICGGIEQMEQQYKNRWRIGYDNAQTKHFSRFSIVIKVIKARAATGELASDVVAQLDVIFSSCRKRSLAIFCDSLKEKGIYQAKQRNPRSNRTPPHCNNTDNIT